MPILASLARVFGRGAPIEEKSFGLTDPQAFGLFALPTVASGVPVTAAKLALPMAGGLVAGIVGGGVAGVIGSLDRVAGGMAAIGDEAKRAGLSATVFQEWKFLADQNRVGVDALVDGFKELSLRADEFILTGKGSSAEAFKRLGFSAESLAQKLKDPSALMLEIMGRLEGLDKRDHRHGYPGVSHGGAGYDYNEAAQRR